MYNISIYNTDLERQGIITTFISLIWKEGYNTEGLFQLEAAYSEDVVPLFELEWYAGLTGHDTLMVIKSIQITEDTVVVNGYPATHIFSDRISTEVVSNTNAEEAMRGLVEEMEPYPCIELGECNDLTDKFSAQTSDGTLLEYFETIAQACEQGFRLRHDATNRKLLFEVYKGEENANAKFSTKYGNMQDITYSLTSNDYKNVAYVAGSGSGDDRITVVVGDTDSEGTDRREMYVDARQEQPEEDETDEEYEERLIAYGEEKLLEQVKVESIDFSLDDDVELGDVVFCYIPEIGINAKVRVAAIEEVSQKNVTTKTVTLGTPIILKRY